MRQDRRSLDGWESVDERGHLPNLANDRVVARELLSHRDVINNDLFYEIVAIDFRVGVPNPTLRNQVLLQHAACVVGIKTINVCEQCVAVALRGCDRGLADDVWLCQSYHLLFEALLPHPPTQVSFGVLLLIVAMWLLFVTVFVSFRQIGRAHV